LVLVEHIIGSYFNTCQVVNKCSNIVVIDHCL
jgi:hypothetical protein